PSKTPFTVRPRRACYCLRQGHLQTLRRARRLACARHLMAGVPNRALTAPRAIKSCINPLPLRLAADLAEFPLIDAKKRFRQPELAQCVFSEESPPPHHHLRPLRKIPRTILAIARF